LLLLKLNDAISSANTGCTGEKLYFFKTSSISETMDFKFLLSFFFIFPAALARDFVKLSNVEVLTLYHGRMTTGRRSAPVPQLQCVGGSARYSFTPQVVQCYNRGSDGDDIQWECKAELDKAYQFGKISVSCEGYSYPDDPYILKGSCGLEFTLEFTKGGSKQKVPEHNYFGGQSDKSSPKQESSLIGSFIILAACCLIIYGLYKTCIAPSEQMYQSSSTAGDFGGYPGGNNYSYPNNAPPQPGFRSYFTMGASGRASCGGAGRTGPSSSAGGFWTGAATGGLLGYMFGRQGGNRDYNSRRSSGTEDYSRAFGGSSSSDYRRGSSETRTTSGFGGTTRR